MSQNPQYGFYDLFAPYDPTSVHPRVQIVEITETVLESLPLNTFILAYEYRQNYEPKPVGIIVKNISPGEFSVIRISPDIMTYHGSEWFCLWLQGLYLIKYDGNVIRFNIANTIENECVYRVIAKNKLERIMEQWCDVDISLHTHGWMYAYMRAKLIVYLRRLTHPDTARLIVNMAYPWR